jgi:hypothetical protein
LVGIDSMIYRAYGSEKMASYEGLPVRWPITHLAPKLRDMAYEDVKDCRRLATAFLGDDYDDDTPSCNTIVSGLS